MNAQQRLQTAHLAALDGKYEQALSEYRWFHDHALTENPSLYGVRLSFAVASWLELGQVYPPALAALHALVEHKTQTLKSGAGDRPLFHDVQAINQYLGQATNTAHLFQQLEAEQNELAQKCADLALDALVAAGQFELAGKYLPEPVQRISRMAQRLNEDIARITERPRSKSPRYRAYTVIFAQELQTTVSILQGAQRIPEAQACEAAALAALKPWYLRKAVERSLLRTC